MNDKQANRILDEMEEMFGDSLANPDHYPLTFMHQCKLFRYYKNRKTTQPANITPRG